MYIELSYYKFCIIIIFPFCLQAAVAQQFELFIIQFGCAVDSDGDSCFAAQQDGQLDDIRDAFMVKLLPILFTVCERGRHVHARDAVIVIIYVQHVMT